MQKRVLISVFDKTNLIELAQFLEANDYQIISTGGTYKYLTENNINPLEVSDLTKFPEILDGRVKTLHPAIHSGILAKRNKPEHLQTLIDQNLPTIDIVIVNLYPFFENAGKDDLSLDQKIEFIDVGGPTMLRAAAKNYQDVTVLTDVNDYALVITQIKEKGNTTLAFRQNLAAKVFNLTSTYDAAIAQLLSNDTFPTYFNASYKKEMDLRYGENPHQKAAYYVNTVTQGAMRNFDQLGGKELSFNNIRDMDLAWKVVCEFTSQLACCAVKHSSPCGVAIGVTPKQTYLKTLACDPVSIFGGIVAMNHTVDGETAEELNKLFLEIVLAKDFTPDALQILEKKKNLRIIKINEPLSEQLTVVKVDGGLIVQTVDNEFSTNFDIATNIKPTDEQMKSLLFAQRVAKYVKSNAIVVASNQQAYGIGGGQVNRIWAAEQALERATEKQKEELVMASDAFLPFRDVVDTAAKYGIKAIIQPGGSIRDQESIDACNEHGIAMVITGMRHFLH